MIIQEAALVSILYRKSITGCESDCIRTMIKDMMDCIKSRYPLSIVDEYEFRLVLNELIANGTIHGNKRLGDKTITAQIDAIDKYTVGITIEDEGSGFDYKGFLNQEFPCDKDPYSEGGRGLKLIKAICDHIRFNQGGNQIMISKSIKNKKF